MDIFQSILAARLIFIFGIINLVTGVLVLLTCRCLPSINITGKLTKSAAYRHLFKYHCYIWWVFWVSVIVHAIFAIAFLGLPF
ncbi:hypothetical protein ACFLUZ_06635 [Chloroflexota bacterium]